MVIGGNDKIPSGAYIGLDDVEMINLADPQVSCAPIVASIPDRDSDSVASVLFGDEVIMCGHSTETENGTIIIIAS